MMLWEKSRIQNYVHLDCKHVKNVYASCSDLRWISLEIWGHLGGSVTWASNSWFSLRSWSQCHEVEPLITQHETCLWFSLFCPTTLLALSLSLKKFRDLMYSMMITNNTEFNMGYLLKEQISGALITKHGNYVRR